MHDFPGPTEQHTRLNLTAGVASVSVALILVIAKLWALSQTGAMSIAASLAVLPEFSRAMA